MSSGAVSTEALASLPASPERRRAVVVTAWLGGAVVLVLAASLAAGALAMGPRELLAALTSQSADPLLHATVWQVRLPRGVLTLAVGAALSLAGLCLQALFRNPLAEPALLGTSAGAALGAVFSIVFVAHPGALFPLAFAGALGGTLLSAQLGEGDTARLLLGGIAVNALCFTGVGLLSWLANDAQLRSITFWNLGSFAGASWQGLWPALLSMGLGTALLASRLPQLNVLLLGEREAFHTGVDVRRLRLVVVVGTSLTVGGAVAAVGTIGFVGLVVPAMARLLLGPDVRRLAVPCVLAGAALLCAADLGARTVVAPAELPVGLVTSALGAPVFVWLLHRARAT